MDYPLVAVLVDSQAMDSEVYLKNLHGQEYKMVPIEPEAKTIVPLVDGKPAQEPPAAKLD